VSTATLAARHCVACDGSVPALTPGERSLLLSELDGWSVVEGHHLSKDFTFPDFVAALAFANLIGAIAEEEAHHPQITIAWGLLRVEVWTLAINGLTDSDFILAAKCDEARFA